MAEIQLPLLFQNGMILQRRKPICIWGKAQGAELVTVELAGKQAVARVEGGVWQTYLPPVEAGTGLTLKITAEDQEILIEDVAIGEVWIAGGQSNMEFLLRDDAEAQTAQQINEPDIRCFEVPKISYAGQEKDRDYSEVGLWRKACGKESLYFSAVGFYFARDLYARLGVPVGIINCTWGGTSASVFTAKEYLTGPLRFFLDRAEEARSKLDPATEYERFKQMQAQMDSLPIDNSVPNLAPIFPDAGMLESMKEMDALNQSVYSPFRPCGLYETMLKTIAPSTVSGVIWYQGESDEPFTALYEQLMQAMIACWRELWHETLPFLMVQLASFEYMVEPLNFVPIRAIQERLTKTEEKVWLVCAMDVGMQYDIHPKHKRPVGRRLALQALSKVYGISLLADSPETVGASRHGREISISFAHCGDGLVCKDEEIRTVEVRAEDSPVENVEICLAGDRMILRAAAFETGVPVTVDFAQKPYCIDNVYNSAGLPVLPFTLTVQ